MSKKEEKGITAGEQSALTNFSFSAGTNQNFKDFQMIQLLVY